MKASVEIDSEKAEQMEKVLSLSLESQGDIDQEVESKDDKLKTDIKTESLGQLRGCTDTVFRLGTLSKKILER
jgi:tRNA threonylcarbamoyladenosine modification (KEOPS) complex  Pcc1 subunit